MTGSMPSRQLLARARDFLASVPLIDAHNDLPYVVRHSAAAGDLAAYDLTAAHQETDTDIPRLRKGQLAGQFWAAFVPSNVADPCRYTLDQIALIRRMNARHADTFLGATRASHLGAAKRAGRIASYISVESSIGLNGSLEPLELWYALGVRYLTLCHNETLDWVDSATDAPRHGGLAPFGRQVVAECNRLGILVDVAHTAHQAQMQVLECTSAPIAMTHANAFSLVDHPRNAADAFLDGLKANGGIICATFVQTFSSQATRDWVKAISDRYGKPPPGDMKAGLAARESAAGPCPRATLAQVCDHIEYMANRAGLAHVGIGSDYYGSRNPDGLEDVGTFPNLFAELMLRGWSDGALARIASGNFLRVLRAVESHARAARPQPALASRRRLVSTNSV